jgi:gamma-glutamyl phosphate reductase
MLDVQENSQVPVLCYWIENVAQLCHLYIPASWPSDKYFLVAYEGRLFMLGVQENSQVPVAFYWIGNVTQLCHLYIPSSWPSDKYFLVEY